MSDTNESNLTNDAEKEPVAEQPSQAQILEQMADMQAQMQALREENAALKAAQEHSVMEIPNDGQIELDEVAMARLKNKVADKNVRMMTITIAGAEGEKNRPVFVGVQGVGWTINRGVRARVPEPVVHALSNAIKTVYNCDLEGNIESTEVPTYPYTVHI